MDVSHAEYTLQGRGQVLQNVWSALLKVFASDPGLVIQIALVVPAVIGGILLQLNAVQWILIVFATLLFLVAGIMRTAANLQVKHDKTLTADQVTRVRCMGNAVVLVTSGLITITYMMVFIPKIILFL